MFKRPRNRLVGAIRDIVAPARVDSGQALAHVTTGFRLDAGRTGHARVPGVRKLGGIPVLFLRIGSGTAVYTSDRPDGEIFAPVVVGDTLVFCDRTEKSCYACDLASRARRWKVSLPNDQPDAIMFGEPAIEDGLAIVGTQIGTFAIELATGAFRWKRELATNEAVLATNRLVFVADSSGDVHALSTKDGAEVWRASLKAPAASAMACIDDALFVQTASRLVALDRSNGEQRWEVTTKAPTWHVALRPAVTASASTVFAAGDAKLGAYDAKTGALKWCFDEATPRAAIAFADGVVYVAASLQIRGPEGTADLTERASLYALDAGTGAVKWRTDLEAYAKTAPVVAADVVYLFEALRGRAEPFRLHAYDTSSGRELWSYADFAVSSEPVAASGCVLWGTNKGVVKAVW